MKCIKSVSLCILLFAFSCTAVLAGNFTYTSDWLKLWGNNFFGIGIWDDPSYYDELSEINNEYTNFNVLHANYSSVTDDMDEKVIITGHRTLEYYLKDGRADADLSFYSNTNGYIDYYEMNDLLDNYNDVEFESFCEDRVEEIDNAMDNHGINKYIIYVQDEPERMFGSWCMYPEILETYRNEIDSYMTTSNSGNCNVAAIGYGPINGNICYYDSIYGDPNWNGTYGVTYYKNYNGVAYGSSVYTYYDENVQGIVNRYKDSAELHMLNSYSAFDADVAYAAKTVDSMKEESPGPVWLWFDATRMDDSGSYARIRCQAYTAMTRKCTGVMLYNIGSSINNRAYAQTFADELNDWESLWDNGVYSNGRANAYNASEMSIKDDGIHYAVFQSYSNEYLLITNTYNGTCYVMNSEISGFDIGTYMDSMGAYECALYFSSGTGNIFKAAPSAEMDPANLFETNLTYDDLKGLSSNEISETVLQEAAAETLPDAFTVSVSPNPFNPVSTISYSLPESQHVTIDIFNISGQKVNSLVNQTMSPGVHSVQFDGSNLASGIYFYRFVAGEYAQNGKMMLSK